MKRESRSLKDKIGNAKRTPAAPAHEEQGRAEENERTRHNLGNAGAKPMARFGWLCLAAAIAAFALSGTNSADTSESAANAWSNKVSTGVSAGVVLLESDETATPQDYTLTHNSDADETRIWIWDYAAEDGDYVQVLVNGVPVLDSFMIKHKPRELAVPAVGDVQVKGIRDGGGGITYAIRYDLNGTSYFNSAPEGEFNTYTLIRN